MSHAPADNMSFFAAFKKLHTLQPDVFGSIYATQHPTQLLPTVSTMPHLQLQTPEPKAQA